MSNLQTSQSLYGNCPKQQYYPHLLSYSQLAKRHPAYRDNLWPNSYLIREVGSASAQTPAMTLLCPAEPVAPLPAEPDAQSPPAAMGVSPAKEVALAAELTDLPTDLLWELPKLPLPKLSTVETSPGRSGRAIETSDASPAQRSAQLAATPEVTIAKRIRITPAGL